MSLVRWTGKQKDDDFAFPDSPMGRFRAELDRLFERVFEMPKDLAREGLSNLTGWGPSVDVSESDKAITVRAELPGVDPNDIEVTVIGQTLTIKGEKRESTETTDEDYHRSERRFGSFQRSVTVPASVDVENVSARHEHGVLVIQLNKRESAVPKRIPIHGAEEK